MIVKRPSYLAREWSGGGRKERGEDEGRRGGGREGGREGRGEERSLLCVFKNNTYNTIE